MLPANASDTCRVLAIDGGGIRGLIPAAILANLEKQIGAPLARSFHMLSGTSTGGILACGLASEVPASRLVDFYVQKGPGIFNAAFYTQVEGPKYQATPLETALQDVFGISQLSDASHDLIIPAYDLEARQGMLFKSWQAKGYENPTPSNADFLIRAVARATSAAPTYFAPAQAQSADGKVYSLIDGGMFANNPALVAFVAARRLMPLAKRFLIVSLGTGQNLTPIAYPDAKSWGLVGWAPHLLDIMFDAMGSTVEYELNQIDVVSQLRMQSSLVGANDALDDASPSNMSNLQACAARTLSERSVDVAALIEELGSPLPDRVRLGYPTQLGTTRPTKIADFPTTAIKVDAATTAAATGPVTPWRLGGAAAGAAAGALIGGPIGLVVGGAVGYIGGALKG